MSSSRLVVVVSAASLLSGVTRPGRRFGSWTKRNSGCRGVFVVVSMSEAGLFPLSSTVNDQPPHTTAVNSHPYKYTLFGSPHLLLPPSAPARQPLLQRPPAERPFVPAAGRLVGRGEVHRDGRERVGDGGRPGDGFGLGGGADLVGVHRHKAVRLLVLVCMYVGLGAELKGFESMRIYHH